ncbi:hypothetical protein [Bradyrhizobium sp. USDA 3364]
MVQDQLLPFAQRRYRSAGVAEVNPELVSPDAVERVGYAMIHRDDPIYSFLLIPGTWHGAFARMSRAIPWYKCGSVFHLHLSAELAKAGISFEVGHFAWSGKNSVFARKEEALRLAAKIKEMDLVGRELVLVAHSYAANLALLACKECPELHSRIRVITLASPFLQIEWNGLVSAQVNTLDTAFLALPVFALLSTFYFLTTSATYKYIVVHTSVLLATIPVICAALALALVPSILKRATVILNYRFPRKVLQLKDASLFSMKEMSSLRVLVLRGIDDEAAAAITIGAMSTQAAALFLRPMNVLCGWAFVLFLVTGLLFQFEQITSWRISWVHAFNSWDGHHGSAVVYVVSGFYFLFLLVAHLPRAVYGREVFVNSIRCDVAVNSVPDISTENDISVVTLNNAHSRDLLRHGIYNEWECAEQIKKWLMKARS